MRSWIHDYGNLWQPTMCGLHAQGIAVQMGGAAVRECELRQALWADRIDDAAGAECLQLLGAGRWRGDATLHAHSERVARLASQLGRRIGLASRELTSLQSAALLHDCGKLALDPAVLGKPGALDGCEWKHIKQHPHCGTRLLQRFPFLADALAGVRHHHERWDGTGYGEGLRGEAIPLAARIIALCDAFDALTHARPYDVAQSRTSALARLREGQGTHFDPALCGEFVGMVTRVAH